MLTKCDLLRWPARAALAIAAGPIAALVQTYDQTQQHTRIQENSTCIGAF